MADYQSNSRKDKAVANTTPPKIVERVVVSDVVVQKRSVGRKFRDLFIEADFRTAAKRVALNIIVPGAKNMMFDTVKNVAENMLFPDAVLRRRNLEHGSRTIYNRPTKHGLFNDSPLRQAPPQRLGAGTSRQTHDVFILSSREDAERVLERMNDILETYGIVSVSDLNELSGQPSTHVDNKWGWSTLGNVAIRQIREGYLIDFPPVEPI